MKKLFSVLTVLVLVAVSVLAVDAAAKAWAKQIAQAVTIPFRIAGFPVR
jgi:hypothetical protein